MADNSRTLPSDWVFGKKQKDGSIKKVYYNTRTHQEFVKEDDLWRYINYVNSERFNETKMPLRLEELWKTSGSVVARTFPEEQHQDDEGEADNDPMEEDTDPAEPSTGPTGFEVELPKYEAEGSNKRSARGRGRGRGKGKQKRGSGRK